jgi:hypothetical protein
VHDASASLLRAGMVLIDHFSNPVHFAREITVMRSGFDACGNQV